jgi:DNA-directed RNA polymerase specialized sigma24 family protein
MTTPKRKLKTPLYEKYRNRKPSASIRCKLCGGRYKNLALHLRAAHDVTTEEYREEFPDTEYFVSEDLRVEKSKQNTNYLHSQNRMLKEREIEYVKKNYLNKTRGEIAQKLNLPELTVVKIAEKYIPELKLVMREWTDEEIEYMRTHCEDLTYIEMAEHLGRNVATLRTKGHQVGITRPGPGRRAEFYSQGAPEEKINRKKIWTEKEETYLKKNHKKKTPEEMARFLGRTESGVRSRMENMGIARKHKETYSNGSRVWQDSELKYMKKHFPKKKNKEIARELDRSIFSVCHRAKLMGLKKDNAFVPWEKKEIQFLKKNYKKTTYEDLAEHFGRTLGAVQYKIEELGLVKNPPYKKWTEEEFEFLKENYHKMTKKELAKKFNCSVTAVKSRARRLGLIK